MLRLDRRHLVFPPALVALVALTAAACSSSKAHSTDGDGGGDCCHGEDADTKTDAKASDSGRDAKTASGTGSGGESSGSGTGCASCGKDGGSTTADSGHDSGHTVAPLGGHSSGVTMNVKTASGTVARTYDITLPATCDSSHLVPLVFVFHGDGGNGNDMYVGFPIEAAASAAGGTAIFVYPDGTNNNIDPGGAARAWDLYHDPGYFPYPYTPGQPVPAMNDEASGNADIDFFDTMVETFEKQYCVDTSKIWITGMSSGGYLSNQFARWRPTVVKATGPQSGGMPFGNPDGDTGGSHGSDFQPPNYCVGPTGAVPAIIIHGLSDGTVDPCNALEEQAYWDWANACSDSSNTCTGTGDSCTGAALTIPAPEGATTSSLNADCQQTSGCGSNPVVLCQIPGMGHSIWVDAPTVIWSFFSSL